MRKYSEEHEWIEINGDTVTVGITNYAQSQLGDIVFVELPNVGDSFDKDAQAAVVESVKAASDIYAPISGEITEANADIQNDAAIVNSDAEGIGWLFKMTIKDKNELNELMDEEAYQAFIA